MVQSSNPIQVYLEIGKKRIFAGALDWPGWSRSGRDEASALQALFEYGPRYARVVAPAQLGFQMPADVNAFTVVEQVEGDATTDFGAPGIAPPSDARPVGNDDLQRFQVLLEACWNAFDAARLAAAGKELRKGPRGGGRDLDRIAQHVLGADAGYLTALGWKYKEDKEAKLDEEFRRCRQAILDGLASAVRGELPERGPRGGVRWTPRYFIRRVAWHMLDHTWEIEDRRT